MQTTRSEPAPSSRGRLFVLQTGLITSGLTLLGVYLLNRVSDDINLMGWYANYVIPVGALLVGIVAGSGYGLASWFTGYKIGRGTLVTVVLLQIVTYFAAQYIEFRQMGLVYEDTGERVGFFEWFHYTAISFAWKKDGGGMSDPLGLWGYAFRGLEIAGFALGGLIAPAVLLTRPYCNACQRYKKTRELGAFAASLPAQNVKKMDEQQKQQYISEQEAQLQQATEKFDHLAALAQAGEARAFREQLAALTAETKSIKKLPARISIALIHCRECHQGLLNANAVVGQGDKAQVNLLKGVEVPPKFVEELFAK